MIDWHRLKKRGLLAVALLNIATGANAKDLTLALPVSIPWRDPLDLRLLEEWEVYAGVYDSLIQYDVNEGYAGILAEKWSFDPVSKTYTFKIRAGAKFSDGSPLTSEDVAYSFRRILFLDRDHSQILTRCLAAPPSALKSPDEPYAAIRAIDSTTFVLGPVRCGETLLNELSGANYGIVSRRSVGTDFKVSPSGPFSGLFVYTATGENASLAPNRNNWRWGSRPVDTTHTTHTIDTIKLIKFDRTGFLSANTRPFDLMRISQPEVYEKAKKLGYQTKLSLPIMTWFLAPSTKNKMSAKEVQNIILAINEDLDRSQLPYLSNNLLERPAREFFPMALNCGPAKKTSARRIENPKSRTKVRIEIVDHSSGEGTRLAMDLIATLRKSGYQVSDLLAPGVETTDVPPGTIRLALSRQFLGDSLPNIFNMLFRVLKSIPDPMNKILPRLAHLEQLKKSKQAPAIREVCQEFHHYENIPLAHRIYAFAAADGRLLDVFSKVTGNLLLEQFPKVGGEP